MLCYDKLFEPRIRDKAIETTCSNSIMAGMLKPQDVSKYMAYVSALSDARLAEQLIASHQLLEEYYKLATDQARNQPIPPIQRNHGKGKLNLTESSSRKYRFTPYSQMDWSELRKAKLHCEQQCALFDHFLGGACSLGLLPSRGCKEFKRMRGSDSASFLQPERLVYNGSHTEMNRRLSFNLSLWLLTTAPPERRLCQ